MKGESAFHYPAFAKGLEKSGKNGIVARDFGTGGDRDFAYYFNFFLHSAGESSGSRVADVDLQESNQGAG